MHRSNCIPNFIFCANVEVALFSDSNICQQKSHLIADLTNQEGEAQIMHFLKNLKYLQGCGDFQYPTKEGVGEGLQVKI